MLRCRRTELSAATGAPAMDPEFQEWPISFGASGYVALYRLQQDVALVVAVTHQKEVGYQPS